MGGEGRRGTVSLDARRKFLSVFLQNWESVGSVTPSSTVLARHMADLVDFSQARCLVEFGPGTGVVTRELASRLAPDARLLVFEISETFVNHLRETIVDRRVHILHDSAENLEEHMKRLGLREVDAIYCGLPFASMPAEVNQHIVSSSRALLAAGGLFIGYCYFPFKLSGLLRRAFADVQWQFVLLNFPPAFVLHARR